MVGSRTGRWEAIEIAVSGRMYQGRFQIDGGRLRVMYKRALTVADLDDQDSKVRSCNILRVMVAR